MQSILSKIVMTSIVMAAAALTATTAMAEARVNVPFSFTAEGKNCPAGIYSVRRDGVSNIVTLQSLEAPRTFSWLVHPGDASPTATKITLTFAEYGQKYDLEAVQYGALVTSRLDKHSNRSEHVHMRTIEGQ